MKTAKSHWKGDLRNPGFAHLVIGMSLFNKERYAEALNELARAEVLWTEKTAQQWIKYVTSEKNRSEAIQAGISS